MIGRTRIVLCLGSSCFARGNQELITIIKRYITRNRLEDAVDFKGDHCLGSCSEGPNLYVGSRLFQQVNTENVENFLREGLKGSKA